MEYEACGGVAFWSYELIVFGDLHSKIASMTGAGVMGELVMKCVNKKWLFDMCRDTSLYVKNT